MLNLSMKLQLKMNDFLSNKDNKQWLLGLRRMPRVAVKWHIPSALKVSDTCEAVLLVGDGTDPLEREIHIADGNTHNVYFRPEPKKGAAVRRTGVNLIRHKVEEHMPSWRGDTVTYIPVICDLESSWIETCKSEYKTFREQAEMSRSMKPSKDQVISADENVMTIVLKGKQSDHLDTMIYQRFQELVTTSLQAGPTVAGRSRGIVAGCRLGLGALWRKIETNETLAVPLNHFLISINQSKNLFHTLIIKYNIFKNNYVGKGKVEV